MWVEPFHLQVLFILTPPAICPGRCLSHFLHCMSETPVSLCSHQPDLTDKTQWYTHFSGAEVDIWATETEVKHRSMLGIWGNAAHFSAGT